MTVNEQIAVVRMALFEVQLYILALLEGISTTYLIIRTTSSMTEGVKAALSFHSTLPLMDLFPIWPYSGELSLIFDAVYHRGLMVLLLIRACREDLRAKEKYRNARLHLMVEKLFVRR